jgi:hypothetical protein
VAGLQAAIRDPDLQAHAFELIRSLIAQVVLVPVDGGFELEIKEEPTAILELCSGARKVKTGTVSGGGVAEQLKMVRGPHQPLPNNKTGTTTALPPYLR